ncbi:MAG: hypothetical protein GX751_12145 [Desulfuromonadaceae bacterium]|nr:hypothetical protein [Desulfuromonadaceae bacterium]
MSVIPECLVGNSGFSSNCNPDFGLKPGGMTIFPFFPEPSKKRIFTRFKVKVFDAQPQFCFSLCLGVKKDGQSFTIIVATKGLKENGEIDYGGDSASGREGDRRFWPDLRR